MTLGDAKMTVAGRVRKLNFKSGFSAVASIFILLLMIKNSSLAYEVVVSALKTCAGMLIPSLFPLMVASEIATKTGAIDLIGKRLLSPLARLFGMSKTAVSPFLLGLVGGYTTSCTSAVHLYESGRITKRECESIIALSGMPSMAFLSSFVGSTLFKNSTVGWIMWGATVVSSILCGILNRFHLLNKQRDADAFSFPKAEKKSFSSIAIGAIIHSAYAMLTVCACVVFFSVLIELLSIALSQLGISGAPSDTLLGALEITQAVKYASSLTDTRLGIILTAFYVGWSGLSVHFQTIALCDGCGLSFKRYFLLKAIQGTLCAVLIALSVDLLFRF